MVCVDMCVCVSSYTYKTVSSALKTSNGMKHQNADYKNTILPHGIFVK